MSKINVEFDTVSKVLAVSIDGAAVADVMNVQLYPSWDDDDEFRCVIGTRTKDETTDITTFTQLVASETVEAKEALTRAKAEQSDAHPGFVTIKDTLKTKAHTDIADFFSND